MTHRLLLFVALAIAALLTQAYAQEPAASAPSAQTNDAAMKQAFEQIARREAAASAAIDAQNKHPRRKYITPRTADARAAYYYTRWKQKIERVGGANYPSGLVPAGSKVTAKILVSNPREDTAESGLQ